MADAIYQSQWYENLSSVEQKIAVTMVIIRSHVPPKLSAYGMIDINIATLGKVCIDLGKGSLSLCDIF